MVRESPDENMKRIEEENRERKELEAEHQEHVQRWEFRCLNVKVSHASRLTHNCEVCGRRIPDRSLHIRVTQYESDFHGDHYCWGCAIKTFGPDGPVATVWIAEDEAGRPTGVHEHGAGCMELRGHG